MLRAIYRDSDSNELVVRGDVCCADIHVSASGGIRVDICYGDSSDRYYVSIPVESKVKAESILREATVSGLLDFTV